MAIDRRATRLGVLALVATTLFSLLGVRLWFLQTVRADELQEATTAAKTRTVRVAPERGRIFDAEGRILADNQRVLTVAVDWQQLRRKVDREEIFRRLSAWVDVPVEEMQDRFDSGIDSPFLPMPIKRGIDEPTAIALEERIEDFPGLQILTEWERVYPYAPHAAHVIGYMGAIQEGQADEFKAAGYILSERVGQFGIEQSMESLLHGTWGEQVYEVDAANRPVRLLRDIPAINGFDIQLTIDLELQQYAEQMLETTLKARRTQSVRNPVIEKPNGDVEKMDVASPDDVFYKAPAGSSIVMDWSNGAVLAMASYPTFDNRWFEAGISGDKFSQLFPAKNPDGTDIDPDRSILVNRAVQGRYNLGSTFKPFTAFAALDNGLLRPGDYFTDEGTYTLDSVDENLCDSGMVRCEYRNATCAGTNRPCVYGDVNVESALAVSSDTFFYRIGERIMEENDGRPVLQDEVKKFGFGAKTGIELPYEFKGAVPDAALKKQYAEDDVISEDEGRSYFVGDNVQLAIGQGLLSATPLQLTTGYATLANSGFVYQPRLVKAIWNPGVPDGAEQGKADLEAGTVFEDRDKPVLIRQISMPAEVREPIVKGLERVICPQQGCGVDSDYYHKTTGEHLFFDYPAEAIPLAGKTGTAQGRFNYPWNDSSAFSAFSTDAERPYVVTAYLEKSGYGSQAAAPVVKCTFLALSDPTKLDPVTVSDPLDLNQTVAALPMAATDTSYEGGPVCWRSKQGNGVLTQDRSVD